VNLGFIDRIWHVRGSLALAPGQSGHDAFDRLEPLFQQTGTSHERADNLLTFRKKDSAAQDKMAVFDNGVLRIESATICPMLHYDLTSRALLFCFVAPLFFLGIAGLTLAINKLEQPAAEAAAKAEKATKKAKVEKPPAQLHPFDKALGAPEPDRKKKKSPDKKPTATPAYVFAGIFVALYLIGRFLEDWLVKRLFRKRLAG
jgi:hypothetical protein